jgi:hypothetical protein
MPDRAMGDFLEKLRSVVLWVGHRKIGGIAQEGEGKLLGKVLAYLIP